MSDNWVVQNLQNTLGTWNEKLAEIWTLLTQSPVFCKCKFLKFADKNGEFCISVLEKVAGCPAGLPDAS